MKLLNLGCGSRYHKSWVNIDFTSAGEEVLQYDLLKGIPFGDSTADVVYHSHLLEHFSKEEAVRFIKECNRVLKPNGIIRVVVPDLEQIIDNYKTYLPLALKSSKKAEANYDFTMLELYDQCTRNYPGGEMGKLYKEGTTTNPEFIYKRVGIRLLPPKQSIRTPKDIAKFLLRILRSVRAIPSPRLWLIKLLLGREFPYYLAGKVSLSRERHQWMYDRFSLSRLLKECAFKNTKFCHASESFIPNWASYNLDTEPDGSVYKPGSLFMEARK